MATKTTKDKFTSQFLNVKQVMELLEVSQAKAYMMIRELNEEMQEKGYLTLQGKINKRYLFDRLGFEDDIR